MEFDPGSFRDRHSRVIVVDGEIHRLLSPEAEQAWETLCSTRMYADAIQAGRLVSARPSDIGKLPAMSPGGWSACLQHPRIPLVTYPYEWSFGMLKDAALLQLQLLQEALLEDMTFKDATPYNIQWQGTRPVFIDIASIVPLQEGLPWYGYRQFCEMFLFPLMLQAYKQLPFQPWLRGSLEGIDAAQMRSLFSLRDYLRRGVLPHVVIQASLQQRYADHDHDVRGDLKRAGFKKAVIERIAAKLIKLVDGLSWNLKTSEWSDYGNVHNYSDETLAKKSAFVDMILSRHHRRLVWDLGCNNGHFSRIAAEHADYVLALDADPLVVERLYAALRHSGDERILPLYFNVADPSPGLGWRNRERPALTERGKPDLVLALAVIHHLVIGANIPLHECLAWFADISQELIIEFVDRSDPRVEQLLRNRDDIFQDYSLEQFEAALENRFVILGSEALNGGQRRLYHARSRLHSGC